MVNLTEISVRRSGLLPLAGATPQARQRIQRAMNLFEHLADPQLAPYRTTSHHRRPGQTLSGNILLIYDLLGWLGKLSEIY